MSEAIVVTGLGAVSPFGVGADALCKGAAIGGPAPGRRTVDQDLPAPVQAAFVHEFDAAAHLGAKGLRGIDAITRYLLVAAKEAFESAGLELDDDSKAELGVVVGTAFSGLDSIFDFAFQRLREGANFVNASSFGSTVMNAPASQVSVRYGVNRLNSTISTGFASGLDAIGYACDLVRDGRAGAVLAGGAEELSSANLAYLSAAGFEFEPAEGAALLVLEPSSRAARRGARVLAEVVGYGSQFDPGAMTGAGRPAATLERAMRAALDSAGLLPSDVDLVLTGANGSGTGDLAEREALASLFGRPIATLAPKRWYGEAMGAAGALAAALAAKILDTGQVPDGTGILPEDKAPVILLEASSYSGHCASLVMKARERE